MYTVAGTGVMPVAVMFVASALALVAAGGAYATLLRRQMLEAEGAGGD